MSLIIIGKVSLASLMAGAVSVGGVFLHRFLNPTVEIYGLASSTVTIENKSLKCKIDAQPEFECTVEEVSQLTDDDKKNNVSLIDFLKSPKTQTAKTLADKKLYKIKTSKSIFNNQEWKSKTITISEHTTSNTSLGSIKPLFIIQDKETVLGTTHMFVGQASETIATSAIDNHQCAWSSAASDFKACKIFPFVDGDAALPAQELATTMSSLSFKNTEKAITTPSEIKQYHYYLIEFTDDSTGSKELEIFDLTSLIYAKESSSAADKITFNKISAVARVEQQLLILK